MINLRELKEKLVNMLNGLITISDADDPIPFYSVPPTNGPWPYVLIDIPDSKQEDTKDIEGISEAIRFTAFDNDEHFEGYGRTEDIVEETERIIRRDATNICMKSTRVIQAVFIKTTQNKSEGELTTSVSFRFDLTE